MKRARLLSAILIAVPLAGAVAQESWGFDDDAATSGSGIEVYGSASTEARLYVAQDDVTLDSFADIKDFPLAAGVGASLGASYSGSSTDVDLKLVFSEDVIKNHPFDVIDELTMRAYFGNFVLEAGKMKIVWGKGDKLHVMDNFNADDYTDFVLPDYIDRRLSTPMVRGVYSIPAANANIEAVWTPFMPTDRFATNSGNPWVPAQVESLMDTAIAIGRNNLALTLDGFKKDEGKGTDMVDSARELAQAALNLYPSTSTLEYSQAGIRATATVGRFDLGASYYYGHYKQPSANLSGMIASINAAAASDTKFQTWFQGKHAAELTALATEIATKSGGTIDAATAGKLAFKQLAEKYSSELTDYLYSTGYSAQIALPTLAYDVKNTFALEAATVLWHFNVRGELAYNLTADTKGDDPWVHNNSLGYLVGFDIDLPFWEANLNVQETGTLVLGKDAIEDGAYKTHDVDYDQAGYYSSNKLVVNLSTSFMHDRLVPEVSFIWGIEGADMAVLPKVSYKPFDALTLTASGLYIWSGTDYGEFSAWKDNSFVSLGASVTF